MYENASKAKAFSHFHSLTLMKIEVKFDGKTESLELPSGATVLDVYKKLNLSTEVYLAKIGKDDGNQDEEIQTTLGDKK